MSSKFGKIAVVRTTLDGWELVKTDFKDNNKATAERYITGALEEDENQRLQIVRFYPAVYAVETVTEPRKVVTTTSDVRFEDEDIDLESDDDDDLEEEEEEDGDIPGTEGYDRFAAV